MIDFSDVTIGYRDDAPVLRDVRLHIPEGDLALVVGSTGRGKSTLLGAITAIVPHLSGGWVRGEVRVAGRRTSQHRPRELADLIGWVGQDPARGFVTDTVEEEVAYALEQAGMGAAAMRARVEETLDRMGIADLRRRALPSLSGGQQQRVAIASVLALHPAVLVLDEPTSALDPTAAHEVLGAVAALVQDAGLTVVLAEHRLERVLHLADSMVWVRPDGRVDHGSPQTVLARADVHPPLRRLADELGWSSVPLSVRAARRRLAAEPRPVHTSSVGPAVPAAEVSPPAVSTAEMPTADMPTAEMSTAGVPTEGGSSAPVVLRSRGLSVHYGSTTALSGVHLDVRSGQVATVLGRNGSGKSSLLWALHGAGRRSAGTVQLATDSSAAAQVAPAATARSRRWRRWGHAAREQGGPSPTPGLVGPVDPRTSGQAWVDPALLSAGQARSRIVLVPQDASDLLYLESVGQELAQAERDASAPRGSATAVLRRLGLELPDRAHPRDLSEGQRLALVLAVQLAAAPSVVLLDEPTRGLDHEAKAALAAFLRELADDGVAVVVSSHDVEFVVEVGDRTLLLAQGELVADGSTREICLGSPAYSPQIARVYAPRPVLTLADLTVDGPGQPSTPVVTRSRGDGRGDD